MNAFNGIEKMSDPAWLKPFKEKSNVVSFTRRPEYYVNASNAKLVYPHIFADMMDLIADGTPLATAVRKDSRNIDVAHFRTWIIGNPARKKQYYDAKAVASDAISDELIEIADGMTSSNEVDRDKLKIDTRKYMMGVWDKPRFGQVKQLEVTNKNVTELNYDELASMIIEGSADRVDDDSSFIAAGSDNSGGL